jgi:hypothetical protein
MSATSGSALKVTTFVFWIGTFAEDAALQVLARLATKLNMGWWSSNPVALSVSERLERLAHTAVKLDIDLLAIMSASLMEISRAADANPTIVLIIYGSHTRKELVQVQLAKCATSMSVTMVTRQKVRFTLKCSDCPRI